MNKKKKSEILICKIFPNPNHGDLHITTSSPNEKTRLIISDISNRVLVDQIIQFNQNGKFQTEIDFINGVYFLSLINSKGKITRKIIVNK